MFSDTPGVLKPNYKLQESMLAFSESALQDADVLLYVTDVVENPEKNMDFLEKVQKMEIPVILLINKIDMAPSGTEGGLIIGFPVLLRSGMGCCPRQRFCLFRLRTSLAPTCS